MIVFVVAVVALAFLAQHYVLANSLRDLYYDAFPSRNVVEPGEVFDSICVLRNEKWLPELFLRVTEQFPREAGFKNDRAQKNFYMLPRRRLTSKTPLSINRRGRYLFRGATISGGDFFGVAAREKQYGLLREVVVLPERIDAPALDRLFDGFLGDFSVNRFIMPDPVLTIGAREYSGREPMKDISWRHSARAGKLMAKRYDHTSELAVTVLLNMEAPKNFDPRQKEKCFSFARRVCEELERKKISYGVRTNAMTIGAVGSPGRAGDGQGRGHLSAILEGLGRGTYEWRENFAAVAEKAFAKAGQGRAFVVITPTRTPEHARAINKLRERSGSAVLTIAADEVADGGGA